MHQEVRFAPQPTAHDAWDFRLGIWLLCGAAAFVALLDLLGWCFHIPSLVGAFHGAVTMKPNTALIVLLLSLATIAKQADGRFSKLGSLLSVCVLVITVATLLEYATGYSFGIDQMLAHVPSEAAGDPVGRMSQGTALTGMLSAAALLALDAPPFGTILSALASLVSLSALVGYLFDAGPLLGVRVLRSMAPRTAGTLFLLQIGYFLLRPRREPTQSLLHSARHHRFGGWYVLVTCLLPLLLGYPISALYHRGWFEPSFAFAVLVVLLMAAQAVLASRNSRSLALVEARRSRIEQERLALTAENQRQYANLVASEARVAQSEAQYRLITDSLPALVSYIGSDMRYVRLNRTYEEWFGRPAAELEGKAPEEVLGPAAAGILRHLQAALSGESQQFETQIYTLKGERTVSISQMPDVDDRGVVRGIVVQANDITARKQAEAALRQTEKLAAVGKLASSIAHEINNPLESITNLLFLANGSNSMVEVKFYLETAEQELARVSAIANQTLRFHRQASKPVQVSANDLLETVMAIYQGRLNTAGIVVEQRHRPARSIRCMDGEIRQVLNNLVGNAIDAMQGARGCVYLRSRQGTDWQTAGSAQPRRPPPPLSLLPPIPSCSQRRLHALS